MTEPAPCDLHATFAATWQTFCAAPRMLGPTSGHRAQWAAGRTTYAVWGIRVSAESVLERVAAVQQELGSGVRKMPLGELHITCWVAGFPTSVSPVHNDDIREAALERQAEALQDHRSFRLLVGGTNSFTTAPFLEVYDPDGGLASLRQTLARCGPNEVRFAPYQPHVTVGTARADIPTASVQACLAARRGLPAIELTVRCVEQLRFDACQPGAALHTHCMVSLQ